MSFSADRLKISGFPSRLIEASAGASAVAMPPPLSPFPPLFVLLLFAISVLSCAAVAPRFIGSLWCQLISNTPVKGKVSARCVRKLVWGLPAAMIDLNQSLRQRSESTDCGRLIWMPVDGECVVSGQIRVQPSLVRRLAAVHLYFGNHILNQVSKIASPDRGRSFLSI